MIGNYIRDIHSENGFFKVTTLRNCTAIYGNFYSGRYEDLRGIPLTEDILLKCGFELVQDGDFSKRYDLIKDERFDFLINKGNEQLSGIRFKGNTLYDEIKYLHQLQNLFFILSGNQLIINI